MLRLTSACVFVFSALALAVGSGYSLGALILLFVSPCLLWRRPSLQLQRQDYVLIATLLLYFLVLTLNMWFHGDPGREYDMPLRALLATPVLLLLLAYPPRSEAWWAGLAIGAIAGTALALWQFFALDMARPQAATSNAIHYGNVSMLLGMLSLSGLGWANAQRSRLRWMALLLAGGLAGVMGSILSGSRSGWLALPVCICIFAATYTQSHKKRYFGMALAAMMAIAAVIYIMPDSAPRQRLSVAISDLQKFQNQRNTSTSIGERLEMWRITVDMFQEHNKWLGMGRTGYIDEKYQLADEKKISAVVRNYTNAHNDYLDTLVKRGLPGLAALLCLFFLPLYLFTRALRHGSHAAQPFALAGVVLCTCYIIFGFTTSSMTLNIGTIMLLFPMVMLWAMLRRMPQTN